MIMFKYLSSIHYCKYKNIRNFEHYRKKILGLKTENLDRFCFCPNSNQIKTKTLFTRIIIRPNYNFMLDSILPQLNRLMIQNATIRKRRIVYLSIVILQKIVDRNKSRPSEPIQHNNMFNGKLRHEKPMI